MLSAIVVPAGLLWPRQAICTLFWVVLGRFAHCGRPTPHTLACDSGWGALVGPQLAHFNKNIADQVRQVFPCRNRAGPPEGGTSQRHGRRVHRVWCSGGRCAALTHALSAIRADGGGWGQGPCARTAQHGGGAQVKNESRPHRLSLRGLLQGCCSPSSNDGAGARG